MLSAVVTRQLDGRIALITGGNSGIGRAISIALAREGSATTLTFLPELKESADETVCEIQQAGGRAIAVSMEVRDRESVRAGLRAIEATFRRTGYFGEQRRR